MHPLIVRSKILAKAGFLHGFSTRWASEAGPTGPGGAFPDDAIHLSGFFEALGRDPGSALRVKQVHGNAVLQTPARDWSTEADAIVLGPEDAPITPVIRTADCVPVLVGDAFTGRVAAVHAGWQGVEKCVVKEAIQAMGGPAIRLVAAIGPCICTDCFEVGEEVASAVEGASEPDVTDRSRGPKPHVDLRLAVRLQLRALGLRTESIEDVAGCTQCEPERFFSFRRDGANAGRQMAVIVPRATRNLRHT